MLGFKTQMPLSLLLVNKQNSNVYNQPMPISPTQVTMFTLEAKSSTSVPMELVHSDQVRIMKQASHKQPSQQIQQSSTSYLDERGYSHLLPTFTSKTLLLTLKYNLLLLSLIYSFFPSRLQIYIINFNLTISFDLIFLLYMNLLLLYPFFISAFNLRDKQIRLIMTLHFIQS